MITDATGIIIEVNDAFSRISDYAPDEVRGKAYQGQLEQIDHYCGAAHEAALREGDTLARIGGDEFIAVMVDLDKVEDSAPILERLLKATAEPVAVNNTVLKVSVSIGVSVYPQDGSDADQLVRYADQAMYGVKQEGN